MDTLATMTSIALQYGVPLRDLVSKFGHVRFEPSGFTGNPEIPIAKSTVDYIFRWLGSRFLPKDDRDALGIIGGGEVVTEAPDSPISFAAPISIDPPESIVAATPPAPSPSSGGEGGDRPTATDQGHGGSGTGGPVANGNGGPTVSFLGRGSGGKLAFSVSADSPSCAECGSIMVRNGSCYKCLNCGATSGCS
jgi:ribonucleoside-diphosphate reductase alpha chain